MEKSQINRTPFTLGVWFCLFVPQFQTLLLLHRRGIFPSLEPKEIDNLAQYDVLSLFFYPGIQPSFFGYSSALLMDSVDHSGLSEAAYHGPGDCATELPTLSDALGPSLSGEPTVLWAGGFSDAF